MTMRAVHIPFEYSIGATEDDCRELARRISPMEIEALSGEEREMLPELLCSERRRCRTYTVRLGGRLAGICFVEDRDGRREMAFTKTRYLTEERRVAFARGIPQLVEDLQRAESDAGHGGKPMYMHVPEGDGRSKEWFLRCGFTETDKGLLCPGERKED